MASCLWLIAGFVLDIWYQLVPGEWSIDSDLAAAEFWKSQCITEMTNGKIEMWSLRKEENSTFYHWLQDTSHINPPEGKVVLILGGTSDETKENPNVLAGNGVLVYDDERYSVYEFDDVSWMEE